MTANFSNSSYFQFDINHGHRPGSLFQMLSEKVRLACPDRLLENSSSRLLTVHEYSFSYPVEHEKVYTIKSRLKNIACCINQNEHAKLFCDEQDEPYFYTVNGEIYANQYEMHEEFCDAIRNEILNGIHQKEKSAE